MGTLLWRWNFAADLASGSAVGSPDRSLERRFGGSEQLAAHVLGRVPTATERDVLTQSSQSLALMLASPAFQMH